jgi:WD40 repeat protein
LASALAQPSAGPDPLLVVDQFEELFTLCQDAAERVRFVDRLAALAENADTRTRVVLGVRADFYARCSELSTLSRLLAGASVPVGPLSEDELRQVVTGPARRAGLGVERALITKIVADAAGQPGSLPLVSHALLETWRLCRGGVLSVAAYDAAGGMAGAIAQSAETVYQRLDAAARETARQVLTRLVSLGEGAPDTRRRVCRAELELPGVDRVLHDLAAARLIVLAEDGVDLAHEALISAWPRLHGWLHADRETLRLHRQLTEDSAIWDSLGRDAGALYRGARLAAWHSRDTQRLNPLERAFLVASRDRAVREVSARRRRLRAALAALTAGVVAMGVLAGYAVAQARRANEQRDLALSRQLVANARAQLQVDHEVALMLAMRAYDAKPTVEAQAVLRQAVVESRLRAVMSTGQGQALGVAFSPDGTRVAVSGADGSVRFWATAGRDRWRALPGVRRAHDGEALTPVFSRDGRWLAAGGTDGAVAVWDLSGGGPPAVFHEHRGTVRVAISADGGTIASAGEDGTVRIRDRAGRRGSVVHRVGSSAFSVAFAPDGRTLAAGGDGKIWVWDLGRAGRPTVLTDHGDRVLGLAFSPDGKRLASVGADTTVRVRPVDGAAPALILRGEDGPVETVAFSPDGRRIATGHSGSDTIRVWNSTTGDDPLLLRGHDEPVWSLAFSPDGTRLVSASGDGTVRFWDPAYHGAPSVLRGHAGPVWSVDVSRDGRRIVSGGQDGTVRVWDAAGAAEPTVLRGHRGDVFQVAFAPDGRLVASAGSDRTVRVWRVDNGRPVAVLRGHTSAVMSVDVSPDGRRVASAGGDATVRIWDLDGRDAPVVLSGHRDFARYVAFGPDGRRLASTDNAGIVRVWEATGRGEPLILRGHPVGLVWCAVFSPDGRRIASGGQDGSLRIWDTAGHGEPMVLRGQQGSVWSVAFASDGGALVSVGDIGGGLRVWDSRTGVELVSYRGHGASVEQTVFAPGGHRLVSAHGDGTVRVWNCDVCRPARDVRALADTLTTRSDLTAAERAAFIDAPVP